MRKTLALLLTLCILLPCLAGCSRYEGTFTRENGTQYHTFTFDGFVGTHTVKIQRTGLDDGQFYYRAALAEGSMAVSYKMGWLDTENPLFDAEAGTPLDSCGGYIWDGSIFITFTSDVPVSGEIIISFEKLPEDGCPFKWVSTEDGHSRLMLCDCCDAPAVVEPHEDRNGDMICDICGYEIILIDPPTNHFLRNQAGAQWLQEITAEDIAEIKIISQEGMVAAGCFKHISRSTQAAAIARLFEDYYWLDTCPVEEGKTQVCDGGLVTVHFILNDGTVRKLSFLNGDFYEDASGNYFELHHLPTFNDAPEYTSCYAFETVTGKGVIGQLLGEDLAVEPVWLCEIPMDEIEFIEIEIGLDVAPAPTHTIETDFGNLMFVSSKIFYISGRTGYYELVNNNLDELIAIYSK